ncbi:NIPSNAP family protein [Aeromicrobium ginsengisoli]|uniref:NIPSNAP family protein n=1 Tax=Aeromicrobium ginsengisoli TaxID=363867 RepID=A0A5M4FBJ1_9ACTN|nr:NIPSNAP family protein [Aeromicrobium ginsengisoli]KAA1395691.1 NIPSNAP family protein [Aeromicrobium ginsengisoli]
MDIEIIELRQYTLKPGTRDGFIERFEREFQDTQEAVGIRVIGTFVDLDDPDRFVWFRGFPSLDQRTTSLTAFYTGPAWAAWGKDANADLIDSDDVLMLKPRPGKPGLPVSVFGELAVRVWSASGDAEESSLVAAIDAAGGDVLLTHPGPNNFALPVREERVVVALGGDGLPDEELQRLRLAPTARSALR